MKIQVMFGSQSDERVFGPLCRSLETAGDVKMEVASAHRHADRVRELVMTNTADVFVAGAGLAAHLPGVVASLTKKPVFGVAVNGAFGGLDAFLSISQMPKDVPVAGVMENKADTLAGYLKRSKTFKKDVLEITWNPYRSETPLMAKTLQDLREKSGLEVKWVEPTSADCQGELVLAGEKPQGAHVCMYVCEKEDIQKPQTALQFFTAAQETVSGWAQTTQRISLYSLKKLRRWLNDSSIRWFR